jgi:hypothetical protein
MLRPNFFPVCGRTNEIRYCARGDVRIRPHIRWEDEGVASTVGTIMALMVFMAFLSMFTSQYVPVWMEENEASHMSEAYGQFAALKQSVDMQILAGTIQGTSPVQMFSPIKLGAAGIPMFASPTPGTLSIYRSASYDNVSFCFNTSTTMTQSNILNFTKNTGGTIKLKADNRYYIEQELAYENDALIIRQPDGQYMKATPGLIITSSGGLYLISYTQVDLRGDDTDYIGFGTRAVSTLMKSTTTMTYTNLTNESSPGKPTIYPYLYINHTGYYERAWNASLNQTLSRAGLRWGRDFTNASTDYVIVSTLKSPPGSMEKMWEVSLQIRTGIISTFSLTVAYIEISTSELGAA